MNNNLFAKLTQFTHILQQELFPRLEPVLGPISDRGALFIAVCAMVPIAKVLPSGRWNGRPSKDRQSIARAFLAKSVYGFLHTRQLLEVLANDATLRRLCGWTHASQVPHESTFSRAFAEFANSQLARRRARGTDPLDVFRPTDRSHLPRQLRHRSPRTFCRSAHAQNHTQAQAQAQNQEIEKRQKRP